MMRSFMATDSWVRDHSPPVCCARNLQCELNAVVGTAQPQTPRKHGSVALLPYTAPSTVITASGAAVTAL